MKLAIHHTPVQGYFSERWIEYCNRQNIPYKLVNCYSNNIIHDLSDCGALLWHFSHAHPTDFQISIKLIASLEAAGKICFPNLNSCWHFDDKVAQKYLLESINAPVINSWVFYSQKEAIEWISKASFPKVFKLKGGAGSANVKLVRKHKSARKLVRKAFGKGFRQFDRKSLFIYELKKWKSGSTTTRNLVLSFLKMFKKSDYEKLKGNELGYAYFQEFLPDNDSDTRIVVIGNRAFGIKRMVRKNDFRASGSGLILYDKELIDQRCVKIAFDISAKLKTNCLTFDFLFSDNHSPMIAEISYGFHQDGYNDCQGYWDNDLNWNEGKFIPQEWMVDDIINSIKSSSKND